MENEQNLNHLDAWLEIWFWSCFFCFLNSVAIPALQTMTDPHGMRDLLKLF